MYCGLDGRPRFPERSFKSSGFHVLLFIAVFFLAASSFAQVDRSALTGTVTDPSGRVLTKTHITVVENATALRREADSGGNGNYTITGLPVGVYTVTFKHKGFQTLQFEHVEQVVGRTRAL